MNLIFSNIWVVLLIYALARGLLRSRPQQHKRKQPHWTPSVRRTEMKEVATLKRALTKETVIKEPDHQDKRDVRENIREDIKNKKSDVEEIPVTDKLAAPVQGLIWSEIFGPPVSKRSRR